MVDQAEPSLKLKEAQLISRYTNMRDGVLHYDPNQAGLPGVPVDSISSGTWEHMLKLETSHSTNDDLKAFIEIMITRAKKKETK